MGQTLDALFLAAHPDDVELFCGGTVAALASRGFDVSLLDLTAGEKASNGTRESGRAASMRAAEILGVHRERDVLGLPDGGVDAGDPLQVEALGEYLRQHPARMLFAPWPEDRHPDHVAAGLLARQLWETAAGTDPRARPQLLFYPTHRGPEAHLYMDVSDQMAPWRAAVDCYADQFVAKADSVPTPINRPEFLPAQEERRRRWGEEAGCRFAEAFALADRANLSDILERLGARTA